MNRNTEMKYTNIVTCLPLGDKIWGMWRVFVPFRFSTMNINYFDKWRKKIE